MLRELLEKSNVQQKQIGHHHNTDTTNTAIQRRRRKQPRHTHTHTHTQIIKSRTRTKREDSVSLYLRRPRSLNTPSLITESNGTIMAESAEGASMTTAELILNETGISSTTWNILFWATDIIQGLIIFPRMLRCDTSSIFTYCIILSFVGDVIWHFYLHDANTIVDFTGILYVVGTVPFVYKFFRSPNASLHLKIGMALLYLFML